MAERLGSWGLRVEEAGTGSDAVRALRSAHDGGRAFQILLLREELPDVDPVTLARRVHDEELPLRGRRQELQGRRAGEHVVGQEGGVGRDRAAKRDRAAAAGGGHLRLV